MFHNRRLINFVLALACFGMFGFALFSQSQWGLEPCPLCIFQRVAIAALGVVFLMAALHHPRTWGRYVYAGLMMLASLSAIIVAGRHVYIQMQPPGTVPACGAPLEAMMQMFPVTEVVRKVLTAGGECAKVDWTLLGLSMPAWVLISAMVLGAVGIWANARLRQWPGDAAAS